MLVSLLFYYLILNANATDCHRYIFDGTAMLFQAFYSRESSFYHKGEAAAYLNPALARDIVKEIGLDLREYVLMIDNLCLKDYYSMLSLLCSITTGALESPDLLSS